MYYVNNHYMNECNRIEIISQKHILIFDMIIMKLGS